LAIALLRKGAHEIPVARVAELWSRLQEFIDQPHPDKLRIESVAYLGAVFCRLLAVTAAPDSGIVNPWSHETPVNYVIATCRRYADAANAAAMRQAALASISATRLPSTKGALAAQLLPRLWFLLFDLLADESSAIRKKAARHVSQLLGSAWVSDLDAMLGLAHFLFQEFQNCRGYWEELGARTVELALPLADPALEEWSESRIHFQTEPENIWLEEVLLWQIHGFYLAKLIAAVPAASAALAHNISSLTAQQTRDLSKWSRYATEHPKEHSQRLYSLLFAKSLAVVLLEAIGQPTRRQIEQALGKLCPMDIIGRYQQAAMSTVHPLLSLPFLSLLPSSLFDSASTGEGEL
jgi:hypothetical protein